MSCNWKKAYLVRLSKLNFHFSENGNFDFFSFFHSPEEMKGERKDFRWKITIKCDDVCVISKWGIHLCKAFSCLGGTSVEINLKDIEMKVHLWRFQRHCMQFLCFVSFSAKLSSFYLQNLIRTLILLKTNMCIARNKNTTDGEKEIHCDIFNYVAAQSGKIHRLTSSIMKNVHKFISQKNIPLNRSVI